MGEYTVEKKCENCKHRHDRSVCERCFRGEGPGGVPFPPSKWEFDDGADHRKVGRAGILDEAKKCVCGDREEDYGSPENSFGLIGQLWTVYLDTLVTSKDVAMMMALLKIARTKGGDKMDNFVDLAGYAACAGELAGRE